MTATIIGLVGYRGTGKTTVTQKAIYDPDHSPRALQVHQTNFMNRVCNMVIAMGVPANLVADRAKWEIPIPQLCGRTIRHAVKTLGTEWGRDHIGADVWTNLMIEEIQELTTRGISVIVDNVRYENEFLALREQGAIMIAFHRPNLLVDLKHESERYIARLQRTCDDRFDNIEGHFKNSVDRWRNVIKGLTIYA